MTIRPFRKSDGPGFTALVRALAKYEKLTPPTAAACRRLVRDAGSGRINVLIAESDRRPVGYAIWLPTYSSFLARPTLFLEDIFVLPECRRLGVGAAFFRRLHAEARRMKCGRIEFIVLDWNRPAMRFYRRLGIAPLKGWTVFRKPLRVH